MPLPLDVHLALPVGSCSDHLALKPAKLVTLQILVLVMVSALDVHLNVLLAQMEIDIIVAQNAPLVISLDQDLVVATRLAKQAIIPILLIENVSILQTLLLGLHWRNIKPAKILLNLSINTGLIIAMIFQKIQPTSLLTLFFAQV
jgi:hypothetical protein